MCSDLLDLYTSLKASPLTTTPSTSSTSSTSSTPRKKDSASRPAVNPQTANFISFLESHEEWKKMQPALKMEVTWATPPPERPVGGMGMMGGMGGRGRGITGFERDTMEEVLLDMPTNKFKHKS